MPKLTAAQMAYKEPGRLKLLYYAYLWRRRDKQ